MSATLSLFPALMGDWEVVRDGNPEARELFRRHYSYQPYADGREPSLFVGPGQKLVLLSWGRDALFVWRKYISDDGQTGVNCAVFRNESPRRASELILSAEERARAKWPHEKRFFTYVNPGKVASANPGYCFKMAGWRFVGVTKWNGLLILAKESHHTRPHQEAEGG